MYNPFGPPLLFSYSVSSTMSRSSMSTTTTTTQQQHQVTEQSQWSSVAPATTCMTGAGLREKMANSFSSQTSFPARDEHGLDLTGQGQHRELKLSSSKSGLDESALNAMFASAGNDYKTMPALKPQPRAIKKVFIQATEPSSVESSDDYVDRLCSDLKDNLRMRVNSSSSPSSPGSASSSASVLSSPKSESAWTRSESPQCVANKQASKRASASGSGSCSGSGRGARNASSRPRRSGGQKMPVRSRDIDMETFLKEASQRDLYINPADRMYSSARQSQQRAPADQQNRPQSACQPSAASSRPNFCSFCKNNGEEPVVYMSHPLKDSLGKNACPILRNYVCPKCHESGDYAHTNKYCPLTQRRQKESKIRQFMSSSRD